MKDKLQQLGYLSSFSAKSHQSYAPFGSVSLRNGPVKKKKIQPALQLGPGSYDISLPIIKPIIQTIKKKNNNIIVKLSHIGTAAFQGQKQRFHYQQMSKKPYSQNIGPGKYSPQKSLAILQNSSIQKYNSNKHKLPQRKYAGIQLAKVIKNRQRKAATISQVKKISIQDYVEMPILEKQNQNGSNKNSHGYNYQEESLNNSKINKVKGSVWSKMKEQRIKYAKNPYENIGPGQYYINDLEQKYNANKRRSLSQQHPSSYFRSQSVRSFFDNIVFQTNQQKKALIREAGGYKSSSLGPGTYDVTNLTKDVKQNKFQFFGSTQDRRLG